MQCQVKRKTYEMTGTNKSNTYQIMIKLIVLTVIFTVEKSGRKPVFFSATTNFGFLCSIKFNLKWFFLLFMIIIFAIVFFNMSSLPCWYNQGGVSGMNLKMFHDYIVICKATLCTSNSVTSVFSYSRTYLETCQTSMMGLFHENSYRLLFTTVALNLHNRRFTES